MSAKILAAAAALLVGSFSAASAATVWATSVSDGTDTCTVQTNDGDRANICNSLGEADGDFAGGVGNGFTSSGNFGTLTYTFGTDFTGPVTFYEVTGGSPTNHQEFLDLEFIAVTSGGLNVTGTVSNVNASAVPGTSSRWEIVFDDLGGAAFSSLIVTDNSRTPDGFDIDAISVEAVPLPASAAFLLAGLGALGVARRRRKAA